ncbi:MAG TPA: sugar ABC transporter permease YjfF, partial [Cellvibrio sp.]|nr:sugar ABC transporter permease YjfF [Cellvibrio sp.]
LLCGLLSGIGGYVYLLHTGAGNANNATAAEMQAIAAAIIGGTLLTGGYGYMFGTLMGVLIMGVVQTYISFDGTLSSWWTKIVIGLLLFCFIALQQLLVRGKPR